jgi:PAS domain S-box-containing protein
LWFAVIASALTMFVTAKAQVPTRYVPVGVMVCSLMYVHTLVARQRWVSAAAGLCAAVYLAITAGVLLNSVHAPVYAAGFVLLALVIPLFGMRWGLITSAGLVLTGLVRLALEHVGLALDVAPPAPITRIGLYLVYMLVGLVMHGAISRLLSDALGAAAHRQREVDHARAAEAATELAFHAVFDQTSTGMLLLTASGAIAQLNARAAEWLGARERGLVGQPLSAAPLWSDAHRQQLTEAVSAAAKGLASQHEISIQGELGAQRVYQVRLSPFYDRAGALGHVLVEMIELTDLIATRTLLAQARRLEALGKLSGGVAHDINNMLTAISAGGELVRAGQRLNEAQRIRSGLDAIEGSVQRAAELIRQLLAFGRQDRFETADIDLNLLVLDMSRLFERTLHKNVTLAISVCDRPLYVRGDAAALENVLLNLALNAQDAMPGGGTLTIQVEARTLDTSGSKQRGCQIAPGAIAVVRVSDTGVGMSDAVLERIFEPFFTTKPLGRGSGLGLSAVHGTVRNHHGAIDVRSQEGAGSSFELLLPLTQVTHVPPQSRTEELAPKRIHARVLLADDEPLIRNTLTAILTAAGCEVQLARDGEMLLDALAAGAEPDVVITDLIMPGLSGVKLVQTLEARYPRCPLILMTGYIEEDVSAALPPRVQRRLLRKPFSRAELLNALHELLPAAESPVREASGR